MKVVAVVVIFLVLWQWAGSTPLPCGDSACGQGTDSGHHCEHMHTNEIDRSKREFSLRNLTNSVKRGAIAFGNKLHILGKRENAKFNVEDQVSEISNSSANYSSIQQTNRRFKREDVHQVQENIAYSKVPSTGDDNNRTGSIIPPIINQLSRIERQASPNKNATNIAQNQTSPPEISTKDKPQSTKNETQSTTEKILHTLNNTQLTQNITNQGHIPDIDMDTHKFFKRQVSDSNNYTEDQNVTKVKIPSIINQLSRIERQASPNKTATNIAQNQTSASQNSTKDKLQNTVNETQFTEEKILRTLNNTQLTQNITNKGQIPDIEMGAPHKFFKRQVSDSKNHTEDQNVTRVKRQEPNHQNNTQESENTFRLATQITLDQPANITENPQNTTRVKKQTSHHLHNDTQEVGNHDVTKDTKNKTRVTRQTHHHKNNTSIVLNATNLTKRLSDSPQKVSQDTQNITIVKRQTPPQYHKIKRQVSDTANYTETQNTTMVKRQTDLKNSTNDNGNNSRITRHIPFIRQNETNNAENATKIKKETHDEQNVTSQTLNHLLNEHQDSPNTTKVVRKIIEYYQDDVQDDKNVTRLTRQKSGNNQNNTDAMNDNSNSSVAQKSTNEKRQASNINNNNTVPSQNITTVERQTYNNNSTSQNAFNKDIAKRQTTDFNDDAGVAHNYTSVKMHYAADTTGQGLSIKIRFGRETTNLGNETHVTEKKTTSKREHLGNAFNEDKNTTIVKKRNANSDDKTNVPQNTTLSSQDNDKNSEIGNVNKIQTVEVENSTTETSNSTIVKRNFVDTNSTHINQNQTTIQEHLSNFENDSQKNQEGTKNLTFTDKGNTGQQKSGENTQGVETIKEVQERKGMLDRERKDTVSPKNITIQIQRFIYAVQLGKTKRNVENIANNTNATDINHQSLITKRYASIAKGKSATNLTSLNYTSQSLEDSQNSTSLGSIAVHLSLTGIDDPTINNTTYRERREHIHESHNHRSNSTKVKGNDTKRSQKNSKKRRSTDCNDDLDNSENDQDYRYTRRAAETLADQQTGFNNSDKFVNTFISHKHKRSLQEPGKSLDLALNEHNVSNSSSIYNVTMPQNKSLPQKSSNYRYIMKIAHRAAQAEKENKTINHPRKRRWVILDPTSENAATSTEQNSESYLENVESEASQHTPIMYLFRLVSSTSKTNDTFSGDDSIQFTEPNSTDDIETDASMGSIDKSDDNYFQYRFVLNDKTDNSKFNSGERNINLPYRINGNYFGRMSDSVTEFNEELGEENIDMNIAKPLKVERVRCSCAMYRSDLSNKVKSPTFADNFVDVPLGTNETDKELFCINTCSAIAKVAESIKQEIYCTYHIKTESKGNEKMIATDQTFPEISEVIFCQIYTGDNEPAMQFILSWVNVVLLDVVVCLTGLGIVCMYLICFVGWRKRDNGLIYTQASFATK